MLGISVWAPISIRFGRPFQKFATSRQTRVDDKRGLRRCVRSRFPRGPIRELALELGHSLSSRSVSIWPSCRDIRTVRRVVWGGLTPKKTCESHDTSFQRGFNGSSTQATPPRRPLLTVLEPSTRRARFTHCCGEHIESLEIKLKQFTQAPKGGNYNQF